MAKLISEIKANVPKPQSYSIGQELYSLTVDDEGKCSIDVYVVRTLRGGFAYAILKAPYTWGKKSKRHGDFGWLDPLPPWCRHRSQRNGDFFGLYRSKLEAWEDEDNLCYLEPEAKERAVRTITNMIKKLKR